MEGSHVNASTEEEMTVKLACIHRSDKDDGNREMHLMLETEVMTSSILEAHHSCGMKQNKHLGQNRYILVSLYIVCSTVFDGKFYLGLEITLAVGLSSITAIPHRWIGVLET